MRKKFYRGGKNSVTSKSTPEKIQLVEDKEALIELLYQLADDDFVLAFRGSEWLGIAPHIEEDIAFSSINQDTMGHAVLYYELLQALGEGEANVLAHERPASERRNAVLLELANGTGTYLEEPQFDWAFTVVRHYFYSVYKQEKLHVLEQSSYEPLAQLAANIQVELHYHVMHWKVWFQQLCLNDGVARRRMEAAIKRVWGEFAGVLSFGPLGDRMVKSQLLEAESAFHTRFIEEMKKIFIKVHLPDPGTPEMKSGDGRKGEHTGDLKTALATLSEVYDLDPQTVW